MKVKLTVTFLPESAEHKKTLRQVVKELEEEFPNFVDSVMYNYPSVGDYFVDDASIEVD